MKQLKGVTKQKEVYLLISFMSSFEINKINPLPSLTDIFPHFILSNLFIAFEAKLLTNPGKLSVAKAIATFVSAFFLN